MLYWSIKLCCIPALRPTMCCCVRAVKPAGVLYYTVVLFSGAGWCLCVLEECDHSCLARRSVQIISRCFLAQPAGEPPSCTFPFFIFTQKPRIFTWTFNKNLGSYSLLFFYRKLLKLAWAEGGDPTFFLCRVHTVISSVVPRSNCCVRPPFVRKIKQNIQFDKHMLHSSVQETSWIRGALTYSFRNFPLANK